MKTLDLQRLRADATTPEALFDALREDQSSRWNTNQPIPVEDYLNAFPELSTEDALVLVMAEVDLRRKRGQLPKVKEYQARFPLLADMLASHFELADHLDGLPDTVDHQSPQAGQPSPDQEQRSVRIPEILGKYRMGQVLGKGGMGTVYRAHDTVLRRDVAFKVIHHSGATDDQLIHRFFREAQAAAALNHPHLCPVFDFGNVEGIYFLTMPLLNGKSLHSRLREHGPWPERKTANLILHAAKALHAAHQVGVIHRDLKPSNIIVTEEDLPIIIDFGLALLQMPGISQLTPSGGVLGTPSYMAPEQVGRKTNTVGPLSDVYSLGVVLYEMLTGKVPFSGNVYEVLTQVVESDPIPPKMLKPNLSPQLEAICLKAMRKNPKDRPASMAAFAAELEVFLQVPRARNGSVIPRENEGKPDEFDFESLENRSGREGTLSRHSRSGTSKTPRKFLIFGLIVVSVAVVIFGVAQMFRKPGGDSSKPTLQEPGQVTELLPAKSRWRGTFKFREPVKDYSGDVEVTIRERRGNQFTGEYATEERKYVWLIAGEIEGDQIRWEFTGAIKDNEQKSVVGLAKVEGRIVGKTMTGVFHQPGTVFAADLQINRVN